MAKLISDMRSWLIDCGADRDITIGASQSEVVEEIDRHYCGGVKAFVLDGLV